MIFLRNNSVHFVHDGPFYRTILSLSKMLRWTIGCIYFQFIILLGVYLYVATRVKNFKAIRIWKEYENYKLYVYFIQKLIYFACLFHGNAGHIYRHLQNNTFTLQMFLSTRYIAQLYQGLQKVESYWGCQIACIQFRLRASLHIKGKK